MANKERRKVSSKVDDTTVRRKRLLKKIKLEDECLKQMADEILAEKRRLYRKREQLANLLRERELAEGRVPEQHPEGKPVVEQLVEGNEAEQQASSFSSDLKIPIH